MKKIKTHHNYIVLKSIGHVVMNNMGHIVIKLLVT